MDAEPHTLLADPISQSTSPGSMCKNPPLEALARWQLRTPLGAAKSSAGAFRMEWLALAKNWTPTAGPRQTIAMSRAN